MVSRKMIKRDQTKYVFSELGGKNVEEVAEILVENYTCPWKCTKKLQKRHILSANDKKKIKQEHISQENDKKNENIDNFQEND